MVLWSDCAPQKGVLQSNPPAPMNAILLGDGVFTGITSKDQVVLEWGRS